MLKHLGTNELKTNRMLLRRCRTADIPAMHENWLSDPRVSLMTSWISHDGMDETTAYVGSIIRRYDRPDVYAWLMVLCGAPVGIIDVCGIDEKTDSLEVGYCLGARWWGAGLATEALNPVIDYLMGRVGANRVWATHDTLNAASGRVMEKCGMSLDGVLRASRRRHDGSLADVAYRSILREEWLTNAS